MLGAVAQTRSNGDSSGRKERRPGADRAPSMVIAAFARAKLFGIKILTVDARIVLAPADAGAEVTPVAANARTVTPLIYRPVRRVGDRADLAYAVRLLEEGSKSLDEVRAMRSLDAASGE